MHPKLKSKRQIVISIHKVQQLSKYRINEEIFTLSAIFFTSTHTHTLYYYVNRFCSHRLEISTCRA